MIKNNILEDSLEKDENISYKSKDIDPKDCKVFFLPKTIKFASEKLKEFSENKIEPKDFIGGIPINKSTVILYFDSCLSEYKEWYWYIIITLIKKDEKSIAYNVNEAGMVAGKKAILPPKWVPWIRRLDDGQVNVLDTLPYDSDDPRLMKNLEYPSDKKKRVLSQKGLFETIERWNNGLNGPNSSSSKLTTQHCEGCGFFVPLSKKFAGEFGVCANGVTTYDGKIVSAKHGCGAHSETDINFDLHKK